MKNFFYLFFLLVVSCTTDKPENKLIITPEYELKKAHDQKAVLILFPCYPCSIEQTKSEAKFLQELDQEGITTLLLSYNQRLFLTEIEKQEYSDRLNSILDSNKVLKESIYIGGFSSGGNVAILITNYLLKTKNALQPKGVFAVDSPLDLERLYVGAKSDVQKNINSEAVEEGRFLIELFENEIGLPTIDKKRYKDFSPYIVSSNSIQNIDQLATIKTRFYTEPDLEWQLENKGRKFEEINAFTLEKAYKSLLDLGSTKVELIHTKNRGIRANGDRHPHSWNIVERESILQWMLDY